MQTTNIVRIAAVLAVVVATHMASRELAEYLDWDILGLVGLLAVFAVFLTAMVMWNSSQDKKQKNES